MKRLGTTRLVLLLAVAVNVVWAADKLATGGRDLRDRRALSLIREHGCSVGGCYPDFDGDYETDLLTIRAGDPDGVRMVAYVRGEESLDLPYSDGRTRVAVNRAFVRERLLVYDGVNNSPPLRAAFAWDGQRLSPVQPSALDEEILDALDDRRGGPQWRELAVAFRRVRGALYFFTLLALGGVLFYAKRRQRLRLP